MVGAKELETTITRLCTGDALEIELDLREVTFIDSQGLRAILAAREACASHQAEFFLIRGNHPAQQRLFEITGPARPAALARVRLTLPGGAAPSCA